MRGGSFAEPVREVSDREGLRLLLAECKRLCLMAEDAEDAVGSLAAGLRQDDHRSLQHLDAIRQNLAGIVTFLGSWIEQPAERMIDLSQLTAEVLPRDLAHRLKGADSSDDGPSGEIDLF